jgi:Na+-translocating ferredoxin:NAD+ oxidoreductase RnfD subunit
VRSNPEDDGRGGQGWSPVSFAQCKRFFSIDNPYLVPAFITLILLGAHLSFGILESWDRTLLAIAVSIVVELTLGRIFVGKWVHPASAYITGISVGILVRSPAFWPYALCSAISITSKYVLRVNGRHLWNPSNFGISVLLFIAGDQIGSLNIQWGNYLWPMLIIWALGALIIYRVKRIHITATYVIAFFVFAVIRSFITGSPWQAEIAPITGPMYQLFIFFMITDPKTTVRSKLGQCVVVFIVALVEMILRLNQVIYAPYYALFIVGPSALLIEMWINSRRAQTARPVPGAGNVPGAGRPSGLAPGGSGGKHPS